MGVARGRTEGLALALAGGLLLFAGALVMIGWLVPIPRLIQPFPGAVITSFNPGLGVALFGFGMLCARFGLRWGVLFAGLVMTVLGLATLAQYMFAVDFGIDELFVSHSELFPDTFLPGRMSANAAALTALVGVVLVIGGARESRQAGGVIAWAAGVVYIATGLGVLLHIPGLDWTGWAGFKSLSAFGGFVTMIGGVGLLALASVWAGDDPDLRSRRLAALAFLVLAAVGVNLWQALASTELLRMNAATAQAARSIEWQLTTGRAERYAAFARLVARYARGDGRYTDDDWAADAQRYIDSIDSIRSLVLVNASGEIVRLVTRNPELVIPGDRIYTFDAQRRELLDEALAAGQVVVSPPMEMRLGGLGFQLVMPFEHAVHGPMVMIVGMAYEDVFESMVGDAVPGYAFQVHIGDTLVFDRSLGTEPQTEAAGYRFTLAAPGTPWTVRVWPLRSGPYGILPLAVLALSLISALLIAIAFRFSMIARRRLADLQRETSASSAIWRASRDMLCTTDAAGNFVRVSEASRHFWGYEPKELEGRSFLTVVHPADHQRTMDAVRIAIEEGTAFPAFVNRNLRRDGTVIDVLWSSHWEESLQQMLSVGRDITLLKDNERRLVAGEERLRVAVEQTGRLVYDRPAGSDRSKWVGDPERLLGLSLEALLAMSDAEYWSRAHPSDRPTAEAAFAVALTRDGPFRIQYRWQRPDDGRWIWLEDAGGVVRGRIVAVKSDITEQREAEARLERRVEERTRELVQANMELEAFSYSVSHDLRTPLRAIAGFTEILREQYGESLDADARHYLKRIETGAARMGMLIDDLLTLGQVSRRDLARTTVDLSALAVEVVARLQEAEPGRTVEVEIEPGLEAECDERLAEVVLDNLLGNAWKFTRGRDPAVVRFVRDGDAFCVQDNGVGFDMQYAGQLFGVFQRLHAIDEFPGTGIGLATVRRIIERHGGSTWAHGEVGKGASFCFKFA